MDITMVRPEAVATGMRITFSVAAERLKIFIKNRIGVREEYSQRGSEQARQAASDIFGLQNGQKAIKGQRDALQEALFDS